MSKYKSWQDSTGFIHLHENPDLKQSENGPTFTGELIVLSKMNNFTLNPAPALNLLQKSKRVYRTTVKQEWGKHFSHDNMTGLYCMRELGLDRKLDFELPVYKWNNRIWLHPRDLIFYAALNRNFLGLLLIPLLLIISIHSLLKPREVTSGKCLWFLRFGTLALSGNYYLQLVGKAGIILLDTLLRARHGRLPLTDVFGIYYKDVNHPIRKEIEVYYGKK